MCEKGGVDAEKKKKEIKQNPKKKRSLRIYMFLSLERFSLTKNPLSRWIFMWVGLEMNQEDS